ncbi:MAG: aldolase/citrate lyase family protein [Chloroflexi bacterium]|nr:aldolase/citrate lyase family protein [Chloroflexota bacterium]
MRPNHTLAKLRQGEPAFGLWLQSHSFHTARIISAQGLLDWLLVDMEHTPVDLSTASTILATIADVSGGRCTPLARVAANTMYHIKQALDAGAQGVIVPMINTAAEAALAVRFALYPPLGERGGGGLTPHYGFGTTSHVAYIQQANREVLVGLQIETAEAVANIEAILDTPGLDMAFLGPFDLHLSLGLPPALWSEAAEFTTAVAKVTAACRQRGIPLGTIVPNGTAAAQRLADGFTFISLGTDIIHLLSSLNSQLEAVSTASNHNPHT